MSAVELTVQAVLAVVILVAPVSRALFFRLLTQDEPQRRPRYVRTIMLTVGVTLAGAALVGKPLLDLVGINLNAFGIVGGLVLASMGFEMLYGGDPSRAQGGATARRDPQPMSAEDSIVMPYAIPFMAGPGAITAVITISASGSGLTGPVAALIAVAVAVALIPVGHLWLVNRMDFPPRTTALLTRFGGLVIATIGTQLILGGIRGYFGG